jgi:hypothetical protein
LISLRIDSVRFRIVPRLRHFTIWLCNRYGDRLRMDIQTQKS